MRDLHGRGARGPGAVARWRTASLGHGAPRPDRPKGRDEPSPAALFVCLLLASGYGRGLRMVAGGVLISAGAAVGGGAGTAVLASIGFVAMIEAQFDLCLAGPLLGCPVDGAEIRRRAYLTLG